MRFSLLILAVFGVAACGGGGGGGSAPLPAANRVPVAASQSIGTDPGTVVNGVLSASDADGDSLTYAIAAAPAAGAVTLSGTGNRNFEYTPNGGFAGTDTFTFTASDAEATSNTATVTVEVNNKPVAAGVSLRTSDAASVAGTVTGTDTEGDALTFALATAPSKGTVSSFNETTGEFVYTPDPSQDGADTFTVVASDGFQDSVEATVNVEIFDWPVIVAFGDSGDDQTATGGIIVVDDDSFIISGTTDGSFDGTVNAGGDDGWLQRIDRRGDVVWSRQFGGAANDSARLLLDRPQKDGFYVVSSVDSPAIRRYDYDGNLAWATPTDFGTLTAVAGNYWATIDANSDIYTASWVDGVNVNALALISKLDGDDGSVIWQRLLVTSDEDPTDPIIAGSGFMQPRGIDVDSSGAPIVTGGFQNTDFGLRDCARCPFVLKLDPANGDDLWVRTPPTFASNACDVDDSGQFYRVTVAPDDSLVINGIAGLTAGRSSNGLLAKFNSDGSTEQWANCTVTSPLSTYNYTNPYLLADGSILNYATNELQTDMTTGLPASSDLRLSKVSADGVQQWLSVTSVNKSDGNPALQNAGSIAIDSQGLIYLSSFVSGSQIGPAGGGQIDVFIRRYFDNGQPIIP